MSTESWTVGRLLEWTKQYLAEHGADSPRLDAEVLLAKARGCRRIELYTAYGEVPDEGVRTTFRELVKRRAEGMPVAYLVGEREFYSLAFHVTPDVLIPRPETEFLIISLLDLWKSPGPWRTHPVLADVGTGSGILAVVAALNLPECRVIAIDRSPAALAVARRNVERHGVVERVKLIEGDVLNEVPAETQFSVIMSNPPYVTDAEMATLPRDVRGYEPEMALRAGPLGTEVIERLVREAPARLQPGGALLMEISPQLLPAVQALVEAAPELTWQDVRRDLAGLPRVVSAQRKA